MRTPRRRSSRCGETGALSNLVETRVPKSLAHELAHRKVRYDIVDAHRLLAPTAAEGSTLVEDVLGLGEAQKREIADRLFATRKHDRIAERSLRDRTTEVVGELLQ